VSKADGNSRFSSSRLTRRQARWLPSLIRIARKQAGWAIAAPIVAGLLLLVQVWLLAQVLGLTIAQGRSIAQATPEIYAVVVLIVMRAGLAWSGERAASRAAEKIKTGLRQALFERLLALGPQWTGQRLSGELASTLIEQVELLDGFFTRYIPSVVAALFLPLAFAVVLLPVDWIAALVLLLSAPLIPVFMALVGWGAEAASRRHQQALTRLSGLFADRLRGAFTLKLFGRTQTEVDAVRLASESLSKKTMAVLRIAFLSSAVLEFFAALGVAGVALYVGLSYLGYLDLRSSPLTLPMGLFCLFMAPEVYNPLRQFAANYHDRAAARAAAGQIAAVFDSLPEVDFSSGRQPGFIFAADAESSKQAGPIEPAGLVEPSAAAQPRQDAEVDTRRPAAGAAWPAVQVHDLTLHVAGRGRAILEQVSFMVEPGEKAALMGSSGSGKTSLLHALAGLRTVQGQIHIHGMPVYPGHNAGLGRRVVLIGQRPFFLPGSVADNLRWARPSASMQELEQALDQACAHDFVAALPKGLDTRLGVDGYGLSGGQLHRLALARLFLTAPDLILLDEPTAHLDAVTRDRVMASILRFAAGRTLILATHDSGLAARLGRVLAIENRKVMA
jgi:ATP-binding cassette subfamily C protein CydD